MLVVVTSCTSKHTTHGARQRRALIASNSPVVETTIVGSLDEKPIDVRAFSEVIRAKLHDVDNAAAQRRLHLLWIGFEEAVSDLLLQQEAERRKVSLDALLQDHVEKRLHAPTDGEISAAYQADTALVAKMPLKDVKLWIKEQLLAEQRQLLRDKFVDTLRNRVSIHYDFPIPELPRYRIKISDGPSRGPNDAAITMVTFTDYQCAYCKRANAAIETLRLRYPEQIRVVSQDFPLPQHPDAKLAAEAAFCAREQDHFWHYHDRLFTHPDDLSRPTLLAYAEDLKLDTAAFEKCLDSDRAKEAIAASITLAERYGVSGTPAIFLNGIKLIGVLPLPVLQALIEHELAQSGDDAAS